MKYLLIVLLLFACSPVSSGPKYLYKQLVKYNPPKFYSLVCQGLGTVEDTNNNQYLIRSEELNCPDLWISEDNIMPEGK